MGVGQVRSITPDDLQGAAPPLGVTPPVVPPSPSPTSPDTDDDYDAKEKKLIESMAKLGHPITKVSGRRTQKDQESLYAKGRTAPGAIVTEKSGKPGDESKHQRGQAGDFAFVGKDGKPDYSSSHPWDTLGRMAKVHGLDWGGDWTTLSDQGHVQQGGNAPPPGSPSAPVQPPQVPGNIDLFKQPTVKNPDGTISTVDSFSVNLDGQETLLPTVTTDGRHLSQPEAIAEYKKTGKHLGIFATPEAATAYAQQLHNDYAAGKYAKAPTPSPTPGGPKPRAITPEELKQSGAPKSGWRQVLDPIFEQAPMVTGAAGGMVGGTLGLPTAAASGPAGPAISAALGAWLGGAAGSEIRQWYRSITGQEPRPGTEEAIKRAAQSGNAQMISELVGQTVGGALAYRAAGRTSFTPGVTATATAPTTAAATATGAGTPATNAANAARTSAAFGLRLSAPEISGSRITKMIQAGANRISILARVATENARNTGNANAVKAVEDTLAQMTGTLTRRETGEAVQRGVQAGVAGLSRGPIGQAYQAAKRAGPNVDLRPLLNELFTKFRDEGTTVAAKRALLKLLPRNVNPVPGPFRYNAATPYEVTFEQAAKLRTRLGAKGRQSLVPLGTDATSLATNLYGRLSQTLKAANPAFAQASAAWRMGRAAIMEPFVRKLQNESAETVVKALGPTPKIDTIRALRTTLISLAGHNGANTPEAQAGVAGWQALRRGWFDRHILRNAAGDVDPVGMAQRLTRSNGVLEELYADPAGQRAMTTARDISNALSRRVGFSDPRLTNYIEGLKTMGIIGTAFKQGMGEAAKLTAAMEILPGAVVWLMHNPTAAKLFTQGLTSPPSQKGAALVTRALAGYAANPDFKEDTSGFEDIDGEFEDIEEPEPTPPGTGGRGGAPPVPPASPSSGGRGGGPGTPTPPPRPTGTSGTVTSSKDVTGQVTPAAGASSEVPPTPPAASEIAAAGVGTGLPTEAATQVWHLLNTPLLPQIKQAATAIANQVDKPRLNNKSGPFGTEFFQSPEFRGFVAGATEGAGDVLSSFTSPIGLALLLSGVGPASKLAKAYPAVKALAELPQVIKLQRAIQVGAGTAFASHGGYTAATAPTWGEKLAGFVEFAAGAAGAAHGAQGGHPAEGAGSKPTREPSRPTADSVAAGRASRAGGPEPPPPPSPSIPEPLAPGVPVEASEARRQADADARLQRTLRAIQGDPREQPVIFEERRKAEGTGPGGIERRNRPLDVRDPVEAAKQMREEDPDIDAKAAALKEKAARAHAAKEKPRAGVVKAIFKGWQPGVPGDPPMALYDIQGGPNHGSTVTEKGLEAAGIPVPETPEFDPSALPPRQNVGTTDWEGIREQFGGREPGPESSHDAPAIEPGKVPRWVKFEDGGYWVMPDGEMEFGATPQEAHAKLRARGIEPTGKKGGTGTPPAPKGPQSWQEGQEGIPGFFSRVRRAVDALPKQILPGRLISTLEPYTSKDEVAWKDLKGFVDQHVKANGENTPIPKRAIQDYINERALTLKVRTTGDPNEPLDTGRWRTPVDVEEGEGERLLLDIYGAGDEQGMGRSQGTASVTKSPFGSGRWEIRLPYWIGDSPDTVVEGHRTTHITDTLDEAKAWVEERIRTGGDTRQGETSPHFETWTVPGTGEGRGVGRQHVNYKERRVQIQGLQPGQGGFQEHWPEKDVVATVRSQDYGLPREGPQDLGVEGGPIPDQPGRLIDEAQADVHQRAIKARKAKILDLRKKVINQKIAEGMSKKEATLSTPSAQFEGQVPEDYGYITPEERARVAELKTQAETAERTAYETRSRYDDAVENLRNVTQDAKKALLGEVGYGAEWDVVNAMQGLASDSPEYARLRDVLTRYSNLSTDHPGIQEAAGQVRALEPQLSRTRDAHQQAQEALRAYEREIKGPDPDYNPRVPDYPFKKSYGDLGLKLELQDAAKRTDPNAPEWVGFVGGEEQAHRYGFEGDFSKLAYDPLKGELIAYKPDGTVAKRYEIGRDVTVGDLATYMQEDLAYTLHERIQEFDASKHVSHTEPREVESWGTRRERDRATEHWREREWENEREYQNERFDFEEVEVPDPDNPGETMTGYHVSEDGEVVKDPDTDEREPKFFETRQDAERYIENEIDSNMDNFDPDWPGDEEVFGPEGAGLDPNYEDGDEGDLPEDVLPSIEGQELFSEKQYTGMLTFYDNFLKSRLEKILAPFGGGAARRVDIVGGRYQHGETRPAYAWVMDLTPDMKEKILKAGFSLMAVALAVRETSAPQEIKDRFFRAAVLDARRNKRSDLPPGLLPGTRTPTQVLHGRP